MKNLKFHVLLLSFYAFSYAQRKCVSGDCQNGYGRMEFVGRTGYYEGNFKQGKFNGVGRFVDSYDRIYSGYFSNDTHYGWGSRYDTGLITYGYFEYYEFSDEYGLLFETLKKHQDLVFSKFKKGNLLTATKIYIPWVNTVQRTYDLKDLYENTVGERTFSNMEFGSEEFPGYVNNTKRNIFIRCYRKKYMRDRGNYEYIDDSFIVPPGGQVMANFRAVPDNFLTYENYLEENKNAFVYIGQYYLEQNQKPLTIYQWETAMGFAGNESTQKETVQTSQVHEISTSSNDRNKMISNWLVNNQWRVEIKWSNDIIRNINFAFNSDGTVENKGFSYYTEPDQWTVKDDRLTITMGNNSAFWIGEISYGQTVIQGTMKNKEGKSGTWKMSKE